MSRRTKIWAWIAGSLASLLVLSLLIGIGVIRSAWFANYVARKIVSVTEESTGGRAELGSFAFDWRHLHARVTGFVLHGKEAAGSAPLLRIEVIDLRLKLLPSFTKTVDLQYLGIDRPSANIIVFPDGTTNIPAPKVPSKSNKSALETVVDLAIHQFDLNQGTIAFADQIIPLAAHGRDLRAQLLFNIANNTYRGNINFNTIQFSSQGRPPLEASVTIPILIGKDRVEINQASLKTAASTFAVTGSLAHLNNPVIDAHVITHLSLAEIQRATGTAMGACAKGLPCFADADIEAHFADQNGQQQLAISKASISMGRSQLNASGNRTDVSIAGKLAMDEIGGIFQFPGDSIGDVQIAARLKSEGDRIDVQSMRIDALGGNATIDGSVTNLSAFQLHGNIGGFRLAELERRFLAAKQGYDGALRATFDASGDLSKPGTSSLHARAQLDITPAGNGVPVKGRIDGDYDGASNQLKIARASISLPHSLLTSTGVLGTRINADFTSTDTNDLYPALLMAMKDPPHEVPLTLNGGKLELHAHADGPLASPSITGQLTIDRFALEKRAFDHFNADATASHSGVAISNASLTKGTLQATFSASAGLRDWALTNDQPLKASANMQNAELPDLLALAGESTIPATGRLNASLDADGTVGNPLGTISVVASNGSVYSEPFQTLQLQASMSDKLIRLTRADWTGPAGNLEATGTYTHPRETLLAGDLRLHAASSQVHLGAIANLTKQHPGLDGILQLNMDAAARVSQQKGDTTLTVTSISGDIRADNLHDPSKNFGNLAAHADTAGSVVNFRADSNLSGSVIHASGQTTLATDYPTTADVSVQNLLVENLPFDFGIPLKGTVALTGHAQGTLQNPVATAQLNFTKGSIDGEPIDTLKASARYTPQQIEISTLQVTSPAGTATLNGTFSHPTDQFTSGTIQLHVTSGDLRVDRIHYLQVARPGFAGALKASLDLTADLKTIEGEPEITPSQIDASVALTGLTYGGRAAGNAKLTAATRNGAVTFALDSDVAHSTVHAQGEAKLTADYPVTAQFSARDIRFSNLKPFLNIEAAEPDFEATTEMEGSLSGSARKLDELRADIRIPTLTATSRPRGPASKVETTLHNEGPIAAQLDRSVVTIRSAHIVGPRGTDIAVTGTIGLQENNPLNLNLKANADLGLLQDIDRDFYSSGAVILDASLRGSISSPVTTGSLQLKNASVNMVGFSNGISNASGTIALNGTSATIRNLTAESGGGKITLAGFASLNNGTRYSLRATATRVRTRQQGISIVNNASLTVSGTTAQSTIAGTVTVVSVGINPESDLGSILASANTPPTVDDQASPFLANTRLDVRIRTAPDVRFQSSLAHDLHAEADLNLVGTLTNPGMTGRVLVTEGSLIFFGNEYTVNRGVVAFYNTLKIQPQLNVSLETNVKSVDVVITLTGPMENLKLSYRSDPPLQFEEIVALLATGRRPSSDPTIVANEAPPPQQSVGQMGESAIVSQAIASPVSSRLARVFGVTQLSIDPTFASGSALPQASLTLQQRVANNITFTYTQDYSQSNSELVRVEWTISPKYSAVATRDINGIFGVDFFYKRQFR